eukprot:scaffold3180_cov399-Prasinococcus_capsulatus_cf.AAC.7
MHSNILRSGCEEATGVTFGIRLNHVLSDHDGQASGQNAALESTEYDLSALPLMDKLGSLDDLLITETTCTF